MISIIICTCNRAEHLQQTLAAMAQVCVPDTMPTELLVVDNGSTDNTVEIVQQCQLPNMPVRYIHEPRRGQCHARNTGMAEARGDVFLWTDDDVRPPKNWIEAMCGPIVRGEADAVAGGVKLAPHLERPWLTPEHRSWVASTECISAANPDRMVGANMAFSRKVLDVVPEFDTELGPGALGFGDDTLFAMRLLQAGCRLIAVFEPPVEHHCDPDRITQESFLASAEKMGRTNAYLMHHWHQEALSAGNVRMRLLKRPLRLALMRYQRQRERAAVSPAPHWEMMLVMEIALYRQYLKEHKRPRNYAPEVLVSRINYKLAGNE